jgi:hypothetical protein
MVSRRVAMPVPCTIHVFINYLKVLPRKVTFFFRAILPNRHFLRLGIRPNRYSFPFMLTHLSSLRDLGDVHS